MQFYTATPNTRLKECYKARKFTQIGLSVTTGVSQRILSIIENHNYIPSPEIRARICEPLEVSETEIWPELARQEPVAV